MTRRLTGYARMGDPRDRAWIWVRDEGICHLCGELVSADEFHLDHVVPKNRGGTTAFENLQVAHPECNRVKRDHLLVAN